MAIIKRYFKKNGQRKLCYQAQVYVKGIRLQCKTFKTKTEACIWHDREKERILKNPSEFNQEKQSVFFSDCFKRYREEAFPLLGKSTQQGYETRFRYLIKGPLPHVRMEHFNAKCVHRWMNWLKKHSTAKNKGRKNFVGELKFLSAVLNWYRNFIDEDFNVPITKKHRQMCFYKHNPPRRPDYFIKPDNARKWIEWLKENRDNPVYWRLATFMLLTGARVGEACGMLWEAVDLNQKTARVIRRIRWDQKTKRPSLEETTKTSSSVRLLILSDELMSILKEMKEESKDQGLLFTDREGEALKYNAIQASLGHTDIKVTQQYAKVVALLNRDTAEKTTKAFNLFNREVNAD